MRVMFLWGALTLAMVPVAVCAEEASSQDQARIDAARAAIGELGGALRAQLGAAMKAGGPLAAIDVCKTVAEDIATDISNRSGLSVRRTALRVRSETNVADPFEKRTLERFVQEVSRGQDPGHLEHYEIVSAERGKVFRYMKAIPMAAEPCLACHGPNIPAEVQDRVRALYPNDQATGFKAGEVRGAFSVSIDMP